MKLTNDQWEIVGPLISKYDPDPEGKGRPRTPSREVLNGVLWVCKTGARWRDLPSDYPPYQTCHRRFQKWNKSNLWMSILVSLGLDLKRRGKIDIHEAYMDGSFAAAKKGALMLARLSGVREPRSWQSQTTMVFLSPFPHTRQAHMKLRLLKKHYHDALSEINRRGL